MGVYVHLDIFPKHIGADQWLHFYEDTLRFLDSFPGTIADLRTDTVGGVKRRIYTARIEHAADNPRERCWRIVGTLDGFKMAEPFSLRADIQSYGLPGEASQGRRIIEVAAGGDNAPPARRIFSAKTQGQSYHIALLAIAMLAEHRFPGNALVNGDIDAGQAERAAAYLEELLGEKTQPPLLTDAERLYREVLEVRQGVEALKLFDELYHEDAGGSLLVLVTLADRDLIRQWVEQRLSAYTAAQLGACRICIDWLNATGDVAALCNMACLSPSGPGYPPEEFVRALAATGVALSPEEGERLRILKKPGGEAPSVAYQFGGAMLDLYGLQARAGHCFLGEEVVDGHIGKLFPDRSADLIELIRRETIELRKGVTAVAEAFAALEERTSQDPETGDVLSLLERQTGEPLSPLQAEVLAKLGRTIGLSIEKLKREIAAKLPEELGPHQLIGRLADYHSIALSEAAWQRIDTEQDPKALEILIALLAIDDPSQAFGNLRRAVLEHPDLFVRLRGELP